MRYIASCAVLVGWWDEIKLSGCLIILSASDQLVRTMTSGSFSVLTSSNLPLTTASGPLTTSGWLSITMSGVFTTVPSAGSGLISHELLLGVSDEISNEFRESFNDDDDEFDCSWSLACSASNCLSFASFLAAANRLLASLRTFSSLILLLLAPFLLGLGDLLVAFRFVLGVSVDGEPF